MSLRLVVAEDNYLVREGTRKLLNELEDVEVIGAFDNADDLLTAVDELRPDVVVTDIRMPPGHHMEGIVAAHTIRDRYPEIGVVVLSQHADEAYAFELFRTGTRGMAYLLKDRVGDLEELLRAVTEVADGGSVIDPQVVEVLVARRQRLEESPVSRLSPRELDVMREMASGKANSAIAETLFLSDSAIEKHVNSIFRKLDLAHETAIHRRVAAVLAFLQASTNTQARR